MCLPCFDNLRRSPRSDSPRYTQSHNMGIDLVILVISRWGERVGRGNSVILCSHGRLAQRLAQVLYTHKAGGSNPSSPTTDLIGSQLWGPFLFQAHRRGIRTRKGAELRKRVSVFQRSTRGPQARSGSGRRSRTRTSLIAHHRFDRLPAMGAFLFWAQRMGFEPASTSVTEAVVKKRQI